MKILIRNNLSKKWVEKDLGYSSEADLQEILYNNPEIIPIQDITSSNNMSTIKLAVKEVSVSGSGSIDILGLDEFGNIYIIEAKLARNPEAKRKVIGQVLEYAAFLHGKQPEEFSRIIESKTKRSISQHFEDKLNLAWDKEKFEENLQNSLKDGTFKLFIVVDEISEALKRTINYMNNQLDLEIYALELGYFKDENGTEVLIPTVYGSKLKPTVKPPIEWNENSFFEDATGRVDSQTLQTIRKFYEFAKKEVGKEVTFGSGRTYGTFQVHIPYKNESIKLFTITSKGTGNWISFARLSGKGIARGVIQDYIIALKSLGFPFDEEKHLTGHPEFGIDILNQVDRFNAFMEATVKLIKNLS